MRRLFKKFVYWVYFGSSRSRMTQSQVSIQATRDWRAALDPKAPNAVEGGRPSETTRQFLARNNLRAAVDGRSRDALLELNTRLSTDDDPHLLLTLAELSYLRAKRAPSEESPLLLSCAYYAYRLIFRSKDFDRLAFSPDFRLACELYNHSLSNLLGILAARRFPFVLPATAGLLAGKLEFTSLSSELPWHPETFEEFHSVYDFKVEGFHVCWRTHGLGTPIVAIRALPEDRSSLPVEERFLPKNQCFPLTGMLRFDLARPTALSNEGTITAEISLHDPFIGHSTIIAGREVPYELDISTVFAFGLSRNKLRFKNLDGLLDPQPAKQFMFTVSRVKPEKIPVVFVHGLVSTPRTWDQMINLLLSNQRVRQNYQFFLYAYPSGSPLIASAAGLRESILRVRHEIDPDSTNPSFERMVLVGHSMGGLLAKLMLREGGDEILKLLIGKTLSEIDVDAESRQLLDRFLFFHALPFVKRCVFIATPHRGSVFAKNSFSRFSSSLIDLSEEMRKKAGKTLSKLASAVRDVDLRQKFKMKTGIEGVSSDNILLDIIERLPKSPQVKYHSIIGNIKESGKPGTDSIVEYSSAHLDYAASELIIKSNHAAHRALPGILEVERILLEHLEESRAYTLSLRDLPPPWPARLISSLAPSTTPQENF